MYINGKQFSLTYHGPMRYIERVGLASDDTIIVRSITDARAVWKRDGTGGFVLVTFLTAPNQIIEELYNDGAEAIEAAD